MNKHTSTYVVYMPMHTIPQKRGGFVFAFKYSLNHTVELHGHRLSNHTVELHGYRLSNHTVELHGHRLSKHRRRFFTY